jgi:hypothetical protein
MRLRHTLMEETVAESAMRLRHTLMEETVAE